MSRQQSPGAVFPLLSTLLRFSSSIIILVHFSGLAEVLVIPESLETQTDAAVIMTQSEAPHWLVLCSAIASAVFLTLVPIDLGRLYNSPVKVFPSWHGKTKAVRHAARIYTGCF